MSLLDLLFGRKRKTAALAKERLQIILAHERAVDQYGFSESDPGWLTDLQKELLAVIAKYTKINTEDLKVNLERRDNLELLEINVTLADKGANTNINASANGNGNSDKSADNAS